MTVVPVQEAVGSTLCHDVTRIIPGVSKGPAFRKGHVVRFEDIEPLLDMGKEHLYVYVPQPGMLHENEAALRVAAAAAGENIVLSEPSEGRIDFRAGRRGILRVDVETLAAVNALGEVALACLHTMQVVQKDQPVAGTRVIPLLIEEEKIARMEALARKPVVDVLPLRSALVGIVTTGSEIYSGRVRDGFGPVLKRKFLDLGSRILDQRFTGDDADATSAAVLSLIGEGADMIAVTGGMSVDPDDNTPASILKAGADIVSYGAPTFPGAMFLLAYLGKVPVLGLPGCVMHHKASIFDLIVPRLLAGLSVNARDIALLGHGGYCAGCGECRYPLCSFGKG
jgi:hypothetical protein